MKKERYVIDAHCDTLIMLSNGNSIREDSNAINLSVDRLKRGNVGLQCFAAFVSPSKRCPSAQATRLRSQKSR